MGDSNTSLEQIKQRVKRITQEREWEQFQNPKDLAIDLSVEASELLELFQWKNPSAEELKQNRALYEKVKDELSDVLYSVAKMAGYLGIDLSEAFEEKSKEIEQKYPIEKAKGKPTKYNEL